MNPGEKISRLRKSKGISQELLAELSSISLRTIQRIETGNATPRPYTLKTLAEALGTSPEELTNMNEKTEPTVAASSAGAVGIEALQLINFSALTGLVLPLGNLLFTLLLWRKRRHIELVDRAGKRIIHFQLLWTLATVLMLFLVPVIQYGLVQSYVIGRYPPTIVLVYILMLLVNFFFTLHTATQLQRKESDIYCFVPALF